MKSKLSVTLLLLFALSLTFNFVSAEPSSKFLNQDTSITWGEVFKTESTLLNILNYIFGPPTAVTGNNVSNGIITIAVWILLFVTLGDLIMVFSTFSTWVAWVASFLIGAIAANLGAITKSVAYIVGIFAGLGAAAVAVGLIGALIAFVVVNLGIWKFRKWIIRRRAMQESINIEVGGKKIAESVKALGEVGNAFKGKGFK